jgi:hypothetical protein
MMQQLVFNTSHRRRFPTCGYRDKYKHRDRHAVHTDLHTHAVRRSIQLPPRSLLARHLPRHGSDGLHGQQRNMDMRAVHRLLLGPSESSCGHQLGDHWLLRVIQDLIEGHLRLIHDFPECAARTARSGQEYRTVSFPDQSNEDGEHDRDHW